MKLLLSFVLFVAATDVSLTLNAENEERFLTVEIQVGIAACPSDPQVFRVNVHFKFSQGACGFGSSDSLACAQGFRVC